MANYHNNTVSRQLQRKVLQEADYTCAYCGEVANSVDHVEPYSSSQNHSKSNLVASCMKCNHLLWTFRFDSFEERKSFALKRRASRRAKGID